ncbi:MAG: hypothetical protein PHQ54_00400 [Candidatus Omnitrophica bacterium]|nr:hypothetical protein [Candidatus Omnitrophota bacterium]
MNRNTAYFTVFGALCVLLGVLVGAGLAKNTMLSWPAPCRPFWRTKTEQLGGHSGEYSKDKYRGREFAEMLAVKLDLSPQQKDQITDILENTRLSISEIKERSNKQIMDILDAKQQEDFAALREKFKERSRFKKTDKHYLHKEHYSGPDVRE